MYHILHDLSDNTYLGLLEKPSKEVVVLTSPDRGTLWSIDLHEIITSFTPSDITAKNLKKFTKEALLVTSTCLCATVTSLEDLESTYPELFI